MIVVKILQALFICLSDPSEVVIIILSGRFEASPNGHVIFNRDVLTRKWAAYRKVSQSKPNRKLILTGKLVTLIGDAIEAGFLKYFSLF